MQHMTQTQDERNIQIHTEVKQKISLKQRVIEFVQNKDKHD